MKSVCVVIPVYKDEISQFELISLRRCLDVLGAHPIYFVTPEHLNTDVYDKECSGKGISFERESFSDSYFIGIEGYNRLLLSKEFFEVFKAYEYMLIYQLDAYVFEDQLDYWTKRNYDFIGAPLIGRYDDLDFSKSMVVGNGGFSLRNIQTALAFFAARKNVFSSSQIAEIISLKKKPYTRIFVWVLMMLGWHNRPTSVAARWKYNEDNFWSIYLRKSRFAPSLPSAKEAMLFSFERFPKELYEMTSHILPFGCHAWEKYQYNEFWQKHIL